LKSAIILALLAVLCLGVSALGDDADTTFAWKKMLNLGLNVTQSGYSNNWSGGEASNVTWVSTADGLFVKQVSPVFNSRTTIRLAFGQTLTQDPETKNWRKPLKSTDQIDIESVARFTLGYVVDPYGAVRFESQFADKSVDSIVRYLNPAILTISAGAARKIWSRPKNDELISRLGIAARNIFTQDIVDFKTGKTETNRATEGGVESVTDFTISVDDNVSYVSKLSLFKAVFNSDDDALKGTEAENYWKAVDVNWENTVAVQVNKYVQVSFYTQLLYDKEIALGGQLKETLALGLTYKLL
jgi:hypothetical protein